MTVLSLRVLSQTVTALAFVLSSLSVLSVRAGSGNKYDVAEQVPLLANKVGAYNNPSVSFPFYSLPFCRPDNVKKQSQVLGEVLSGDRRVNTLYNIRFRQDMRTTSLCSKMLYQEDILKFADAVEDDFYFEMFLDGELGLWGYVGEHEDEDLILGHTASSRHFLYTHLFFSISYNNDQVIAVNVSTDAAKRVDITNAPPEGLEVEFTYSVRWTSTVTPFKKRLERYTHGSFLPSSLEVHWLSIINSFVLVVLLTVFLALVLIRTIRSDMASYLTDIEDDDMGFEDEAGWKLVHADVFRIPNHSNLFAAFVGAGAHLFFMTTVLLLLAVCGVVSTNRRGSLLTAFIVLYVLTAGVGGYVSARLNKRMQSKKWVWNLLLTAFVVPGPLFCVFMLLNTIAVVHGSTSALPIGTIAVVMALFFVVALPLTVLGGIAGRNSAPSKPPLRTNKLPREIPPVPWYRSSLVHIFLAGFLPFSAISVEAHYIFASVWGHTVYTLFGILFLAFVLLTLVTAFIVIATCYFQLVDEDYRWTWKSFISGSCIGFFIFAYGVFFYHVHSDMKGFLQTSSFFGWTAMAAYCAALAFGSAGYYACSSFVWRLYTEIHVE